MQGRFGAEEAERQALAAILKQNKALFEMIEKAPALGLENYYIGAGCICQTVWNLQNGLDAMHGISDVDFVYFDSSDLSYEAEDAVIQKGRQLFAPLPIAVDIKNQARVHLWYRDYHGYDLKPYASLEEAIDSWPTTATAVGVRLENGELTVYAPFGLDDLFHQVVRANKAQITEETYIEKCKKWKNRWPFLTITEWDTPYPNN